MCVQYVGTKILNTSGISSSERVLKMRKRKYGKAFFFCKVIGGGGTEEVLITHRVGGVEPACNASEVFV